VIIVDTDALSHVQKRNPLGILIQTRINSLDDDNFSIASVSAYEMLSGTLALIERRKRDRGDLVTAFHLLEELLNFLVTWNGRILPYDAKAEEIYKSFTPRVRQELKDDARIAAVALSKDASVWTCNVTDYARVPGLSVFDARTGLKVSSH
jgi:predicted nucleic acid-binding protein